MIRVETPPGYAAERRYICDVLLGEFLGLPFRLEESDRLDVRITLDSAEEDRELLLADHLFRTAESDWLCPASLPPEPLAQWETGWRPAEVELVDAVLPVIYGQRPFLEVGANRVVLGLDVLGSAFFVLTRYEEVVSGERDSRDRFPGTTSLASRAGFLERPVVNEYLEVLWWALKQLWPGLERRCRTYQIHVTHDVDETHCLAARSPAQVLKSAAGDLIRRRSLPLALRRLRSYGAVRAGNLDADICNTFDWIMSVSEARGLQSAFYFITDHTGGAIDGTYSIHHPWVSRLLRRIHDRGHEIGLHPSYETFRDPAQIRREFGLLQGAALAAGVNQERFGGRQHYLRWEAPGTWQAWEEAGLAYDSTLSFADRAGFRCGVCYEYPVFNLMTRRPLNLRERPLTLMEATVLEYMGMKPDRALATASRLAKCCRLYQGDFTLLWHNTRLLSAGERALYHQFLEVL